MKKQISRIILISLGLFFTLNAQGYIEADPFNLMFYEKASFQNGQDSEPLLIRPVFKSAHNPGHRWTLSVRNEFFYNSNAPNLENTSDRWIGRGVNFFTSFRIAYMGKFIIFTAEPFYFMSQNRNYRQPLRKDRYSRLNDVRVHTRSPYIAKGLRETQFYLHYRYIGLGLSNANMWWGPGIHSSLNMTNNTTGFKHIMIGTLRDKRIWKIGLNIRYIFSEMDSKNAAEPYYTALVFSTTIYSDPVLTVGFSRTYLTGGNRTDEKISKKRAMLIPFEALFLESKQKDPDDPTSALDIWDQTLSGYLSADFPESGLKVFVEYGRNDHAWDKIDLRRQPDHTAASVIGLRKYGFFGNKNLTGGIEYANLARSRYTVGGIFVRKRAGADWYDRWQYDYSSYNGRHWGAHSGPDSDDFTIYFGYISERLSFIPSFNYERHGLVENVPVGEEQDSDDFGAVLGLVGDQPDVWPEVKLEFRLDFRFVHRGFRFNVYYEREFVDNLEFRGLKRRSNVLWFGVERYFDKLSFPLFSRGE